MGSRSWFFCYTWALVSLSIAIFYMLSCGRCPIFKLSFKNLIISFPICITMCISWVLSLSTSSLNPLIYRDGGGRTRWGGSVQQCKSAKGGSHRISIIQQLQLFNLENKSAKTYLPSQSIIVIDFQKKWGTNQCKLMKSAELCQMTLLRMRPCVRSVPLLLWSQQIIGNHIIKRLSKHFIPSSTILQIPGITFINT